MKKTFLSGIIESDRARDIQTLRDENIKLKDQLQNSNLSLIPLSEIKMVDNIRGPLKYEEIPELAADIKKKGQLQAALITKDKYLLAGYRRYHAVKSLGEKDLLVTVYPKNFKELKADELNSIQESENSQRRSIDNFQWSALYNNRLELYGGEQKRLQAKFKKSKGYVSRILAVQKMLPELQQLLKEIQVYGWSEAKFLSRNGQEMTEKELKEYEKYRGIIGVDTLYSIAQCKTPRDQKEKFLKLFGKRLTEEEINSPFWDGVREEKKETSPAAKAIKAVESAEKVAKKQLMEIMPDNPDAQKKVSKYFEKIREILEGI